MNRVYIFIFIIISSCILDPKYNNENGKCYFGHTDVNKQFVADSHLLITRVLTAPNLFSHQMSLSSYDLKLFLPKESSFYDRKELTILVNFVDENSNPICINRKDTVYLNQITKNDSGAIYLSRYFDTNGEYIGKPIFFSDNCTSTVEGYTIIPISKLGQFQFSIIH